MKKTAAIINRDCGPGMADMATGLVDLAFCDPPFGINFDYKGHFDDNIPAREYLDWSQAWIEQVYRVLANEGTFWLAIGDKYVSELDVLAKQAGFYKRSQVVWYFTFGVNSTRKLTPSHTHLLYYTKHAGRFTFNAEAVKVPSARQLVYNDKRAKSGGRLPDDTWILRPQWLPEAFSSGEDTWHVPRIAGTFKERAGTPNQMPEPILGRIIKLCSKPGDMVFDPMAGSGTTCAVAKKLGRAYAGFELSRDFSVLANNRVDAAKEGDPLAGTAPQGELTEDPACQNQTPSAPTRRRSSSAAR